MKSALGLAFQCDGLANTADLHLGISGNDFIPYVSCPTCHSVYHFEDCVIIQPFSRSEAKECCHVAYPNHPQLSQRRKCGGQHLYLTTLKVSLMDMFPISRNA